MTFILTRHYFNHKQKPIIAALLIITLSILSGKHSIIIPSMGESRNLQSWQMISQDILTIKDDMVRHGFLMSPDYPTSTRTNSTSIATLHIVSNMSLDSIRITFIDLDLQTMNNCEGQVIRFFAPGHNDYALEPSRLVFSLCGSKLPEPILINTPNLVIQLDSDEYVAHNLFRGFRLKFEFIDSLTQLHDGCERVDQFRCRNRRCITRELLCNGFDDCEDASDEDATTPCDGLPTIPYRTDYKCGLALLGNTFVEPNNGQRPLNRNEENLLVNRIVGGDRATVSNSRLPQVSIQFTGIEPISHICGGVLIHPMFVLTSAHCFDRILSLRDYKLLFGLQDLRSMDDQTVQVRYVSTISVYPSLFYKIQDMTETNFEKNNNLALIELNAPIKMNIHVWPACLPHLAETLTSGRECASSGYGETRGTGLPFSLKKVKQTIQHGSQCKSRYTDFHIDDYNMICVESKASTGPCSGDSGGPLLCRDGPDHFPINISEPESESKQTLSGGLIKYLTIDDDDEDEDENVDPHRNSNTAAKPRRRIRGESRYTVHGIISFITDGNIGGGYCAVEGVPVIYGRVSTRIEWILSVMRISISRLNEQDRQQDRTRKDAIFGYMFRTGLSQHENFTRPLTVKPD